MSSVAREIITGNESSLIGEWNSSDYTARTLTDDAFLVIQHHLVGTLKSQLPEIRDLQQSIERKLSTDISDIDKYLVQASLEVGKGNYAMGAFLLENITTAYGANPTIAKLTQDLYVMAGRSDLAFKSVIRYPDNFLVSEDFRPSVFGMLCAGYVETGLYKEADEIARKSRAMSVENDTNLISTVIDSHNLVGKSSDVKTVMDEEYTKYQHCGGLALLQCGQATAVLLRGNVNKAYNELISILDLKNNNNHGTKDDKFIFNMPVLMKCSFLLTQIILNLVPSHRFELDRIANYLTYHLRQHDASHPLYSYLHSFLVSLQYIALDSMNHSKLLTAKPASERKPSESLWANIFGSIGAKKSKPNSLPPNKDMDESLSSGTEFGASGGNVSSPAGGVLPSFDRNDELNRRLGEIDRFIEKLEARLDIHLHFAPYSQDASIKVPQSPILHLYPTAQFVRGIGNTSSSGLSRPEALDLLSLSMLNFAKKDFAQAAQYLSVLHQRGYADLGVQMAHRDTVHQVFIET